jgi:hypothetical protein
MGRTRSPLGGPDALLGLGIACMVAESITPSGKEESVIQVSMNGMLERYQDFLRRSMPCSRSGQR